MLSRKGRISLSSCLLYLINVFSMSGIGRNPIPGLAGNTEYAPVKTGAVLSVNAKIKMESMPAKKAANPE